MLWPSDGKVVYEISGDNTSFNKSTKETESTAKAAFNRIKDIGTAAMNAVAIAAGAIGAAAAASAAAMGKLVLSSGAAADDINTLAAVTGISTDELQKFQYAADLIDVDMETLSGSLAKLTRNMDAARKGTGDAGAVFDELGVSLYDINGEFRDNEDVFADAIDALAKIENETERDAKAMAIFGRSAQQLNPLIKGGAATLKQLGAEAEAAGLILSHDSLNGLNAVNDAVDRFKSTNEMAGMLFSTAFAGPVAEGIEQVNTWYQSLTAAFAEGGFDGLLEQVQTIIPEVFAFLGETLPQIMDFGVQVVMTLLSTLIENLPSIADGALSMVMTIVDMLLSPSSISALVESAVAIFMALVDAFVSGFPLLVNAAIELVTSLAESLLSPENLSQLLEAALTFITSIVQGLIDNIPLLIESAFTIINGLITFLTDPENLRMLIDSALTLINSIVTGLAENLPVLISAAIMLVMSMVEAMLDPDTLATLISAAFDLIFALSGALIDNLPVLIQGMMTLLFTLIRHIIRWITSGEFLKDLWNVGSAIMDGFVEGITNSIKAVIEKVKEAVGKVVGAVKNFLGIKSPSKVFEVIGKYSDEGLAEGVKKWAGLPEEAMLETAEGMVNAAYGLPALAAEYGFSAAPAPSFALNNQMTGVVEMDGFKVGEIVLRNVDDAAAFSVRGV